MQLRVINLSNREVSVEADTETSVQELKFRVAQAFGIDARDCVLIFRADVLKDDRKVKDYPDIKPGHKIVCMEKKKRPAAPAAPAATTQHSTVAAPQQGGPPAAADRTAPPSLAAAAAAAAAGDRARTGGSQGAPETTAAPTGAAPAAAWPAVGSDSGLLTGAQLQETIDNIVAMGFQRTAVLQAMRAAFNNPERAVEYLTDPQFDPSTAGLPAVPADMPSVPGRGDNDDNDGDDDLGAAAGAAGEVAAASVEAAMNDIRNHPGFQQMRSAIQSNPALLPGVMQMLAAQSPALAQLYAENPSRFLRAMLTAVDLPDAAMQQIIESAATEQQQQQQQRPMMEGPPQITMTPDERAKVRSLESLGFDLLAAYQALMACEWDEERAANLLFEHGE